MSERATAAWLTADVVTAILRHMNDDHRDDNVVICRGVGGVADATEAVCVGLDLHAVTFTAQTSTGRRDVRVPFAAALTDRPQVRAEIAALYHEAAARLGLPPRT